MRLTNGFALLKPKQDHAFIVASEQLAGEHAALVAKAAKLTRENHYLRRVNRVAPHLRPVVRAEAAAQILALWHVAGYLTGRDTAVVFGMSEHSFYYGRALLVVARLHDGRRWLTRDADTIESKLRFAAKHCRAHPEALIARLPPSRRPKNLLLEA